jgi:hypothetical protein
MGSGAACIIGDLTSVFRQTDWLDRQMDEESSTASQFRLKPDFAAVFLNHYAMGEGEALSRAFADLLGREERVKNSAADGFGNPGAGIGNRDFRKLARARVPIVIRPISPSVTFSLMACAAFTIRFRTTWLISPA